MDEDFREKLLNAKDKDEFLKIIDDMENEKYPDEPKAEVKAAEGYKVLAVTACPTGIAHTYMAAEALEKAGKRLGISIKVETNGSGGAIAVSGATFVAPGGDVPSGFLGALLAGFIGGFLMLALEKLCDKLPKALNGIKPVLIYPLGGLGIVAIIMCAINPIMGMLNAGLADFLTNMGDTSKILLGCILGAMMSIDMGGPFNKAAYVFGTAAIASGNFDIMAAVRQRLSERSERINLVCIENYCS